MSSSDSEDDSYYGPKLPPETSDNLNDQPSQSRSSVIGPALPPGFVPVHDDEDDEDSSDSVSVGPLLPEQDDDRYRYQGETISVHEDEKSKREEWMTVIPQKIERRLGFKSVTSFSKRPVGEPLPQSSTQAKDTELKEAIKECSDKKRQSSLLDLHQEKIKKKKSEEGEKKVSRKPLDFDPEKDLQVRKFDDKQAKSVVEKSKLLNSRFSSSRNSKFL